ncbi:MAG: hypothetical protein ACLSB9_26260 [Hydrogeniiclostridium mannosilyticum]
MQCSDQLDHAGASFPDLIAEELADARRRSHLSDMLHAMKTSLRQTSSRTKDLNCALSPCEGHDITWDDRSKNAWLF